MTAEIRVLENRATLDNRSVVETLEAALEQAKAGDIRSVALAVVRPTGACNTAWSDCNAAAAPLVGAVALLQKRLVNTFDVTEN